VPDGEDVVLTFLVSENVKSVKSDFPATLSGNICKIVISGNGKTEFCLEYTASVEYN
jgi:hypothetical protein